jgi:hypothetical protein
MSYFPGCGIPVKSVNLYRIVAISACVRFKLPGNQSVKEALSPHQFFCRMMGIMFIFSSFKRGYGQY